MWFLMPIFKALSNCNNTKKHGGAEKIIQGAPEKIKRF